MKFIEIDGKRHLWRDILQMRREQRKALRQAQQHALLCRLDPHLAGLQGLGERRFIACFYCPKRCFVGSFFRPLYGSYDQ